MHIKQALSPVHAIGWFLWIMKARKLFVWVSSSEVWMRHLYTQFLFRSASYCRWWWDQDGSQWRSSRQNIMPPVGQKVEQSPMTCFKLPSSETLIQKGSLRVLLRFPWFKSHLQHKFLRTQCLSNTLSILMQAQFYYHCIYIIYLASYLGGKTTN